MKPFIKILLYLILLSPMQIIGQQDGIPGNGSINKQAITEIRGNVCLITYDNFGYSQPHSELMLVNADGSFLLKEQHNNKLVINNGDVITIKNCLLIDHTILLSNENISKEKTLPETTKEVTDIRILMVLVSYQNSRKYALPTADDFKSKFMAQNSSINRYLQEVSYGKAKISDINVVDWVKVDRTIARYGVELTQAEWDKMVLDHSVDLSRYDYLVVIQNYFVPGAQGILGYANVGKYNDPRFGKPVGHCTIQIDSIEFDDIKSSADWGIFSRHFIHEIGHTFGFGHANTFYNNNDINQINYYGDYTDVMGGLSGHYSGYFKESVNWLDPATILTIDKDGDYTIKNFENNNGQRLAKIKFGNRNQPKYLYLEYRKGNGFDNNPPPFNQLHPYNNEGLFLKGNDEYFGFVRQLQYSDANYGELYMLDLQSATPSGRTETLNGANTYYGYAMHFQVGPITGRTDSTISFSVKIFDQGLEYPILLQPVNGWPAPTETTFIDLTWGKVSDASSYQLQISCIKSGGNADRFEKIYFDKTIPDTTIRLILPRDCYFWRVRSIDSKGHRSDWSSPFAFNAANIKTDQVINITSPNESSNWEIGSSQNITWTSAHVENVKIDYCIDDYKTFTTIVSSTPASPGSYIWMVPDIITKQCCIRISDVSDLGISNLKWFNIFQSTSVKDVQAPGVYDLANNYPNPFNSTSTFRYSLPKESRVTLIIYNILGQEMTRLIDEIKPAGYYSLDWNANNLASGVYVCNMEAISINGNDSFNANKKAILLK